MFAPAVRSGDEMVVAAGRDRTNRALDDVGADLDAAVVEQAAIPSHREGA